MRIVIPRYDDGVRGLPTYSFVLSNSERGTAACPLRWWFRYPEGLSPAVAAAPLRYGDAWHRFLEDMQAWWRIRDEPYPANAPRSCAWCGGSGRVDDEDDVGQFTFVPKRCAWCTGSGDGPVARCHAEWVHLSERGAIEWDEAGNMSKTLERAVDGYLEVYGPGPLDDFRVVATEIRLAAPVLNDAGAPYCPTSYVVDEPDGMRLARTGEWRSREVRAVSWPAYQILTIDMIVADRHEPRNLWVWESKSSASPQTKIQCLSVDPQILGYVWALRHAVAEGLLADLGVPRDARVLGYVYDVASKSMQHDPRVLKPVKVQRVDEEGRPLFVGPGGVLQTKDNRKKAWETDDTGEPVLVSPGLSRSTSTTIPSWRYRRALAEHGFDAADYKDVLIDLEATWDSRLYARIYQTCGEEEVTRYARELYGAAKHHAAMWRAAARARTPRQVASAFPRQPVCTLPGGTCAYRGPCTQDGEQARSDYKVSPGVHWTTKGGKNNHDDEEMIPW